MINAYALDNVLSKWSGEPDICLYYVPRNGTPPPARHEQLAEPGPVAEHMFKAAHLAGWMKAIPVSSPLPANRLSLLRSWSAGLRANVARKIMLLVRRKNAGGLEFPAGKRVIAWGSDYDALIVIPDILQIAEETGLKPLWVTERINTSTNRTGLVYRGDYDSVEQFSISRYLDGQPSPSLTSHEHHQVEKAYSGLLGAINGSETGARYQLHSVLRRLCQEYIKSLLLAKQMDNVLGRWAGSIIALTNFNGIPERIIEQLAPRHDIKVIRQAARLDRETGVL